MNQITPLAVVADCGLWLGDSPSFAREDLDRLLIWDYRPGASDIRLQTNTPVFVQLHGRMRRVYARGLTQSETEEAVNQLYGADGQARLKGGGDFDVSYDLRPDRRTRMRFRVTARTLQVRSPRLAGLAAEAPILGGFKPDDGTVIVAGGNGKSTLLAAMTRDMLEDPDSHRALLEYAAPTEFVFDDIRGVSARLSSWRDRLPWQLGQHDNRL